MSETISAPVPGIESKVVAADHGTAWLASGWRIFKVAPGIWIGLVVVLLIIHLLLSMVPVIGGLAATILSPVFIGGLMIGCATADDGKDLQFDTLFAGFRRNTGNLVIVGVLYLVAMIAIFITAVVVLAVTGGSALLTALSHGAAASDTAVGELMMESMGAFLVSLLVALSLLLPLAMASWFAPALVVFNDMGAAAAMKSSFTACLHNWLPFTIYGLVALVLMFIAAIPFGLGYLILVPVLIGSVYASYRDIYCV